MLVLYSISIYYLITINNMADTNYISVIKTSDGKSYNIKDIDARKRMTAITWSRLKQLRDNSQLIPGMQYRITNYHTYTTQKDTTSANHQFDVIVTADSTNKFNESARAIQHSGDAYFSNCNLAAWKIWYCLDNDTKRFSWADKNGKGVIYRMIDEHYNDCPYDFKNIQFKRYQSTKAKTLYGYEFIGLESNNDYGEYDGITDINTASNKYLYTFTYDNNGSISDASVMLDSCTNNVIGNAFMTVTIDNTKNYKSYYLNNIVSISTISEEDDGYNGGNYCNVFGINCTNCTLVDSASNTFGNNCTKIILGKCCVYNTFADKCSSISFGTTCCYNSIATDCGYIHLASYSYKNDFKDCLCIKIDDDYGNLKNCTISGAYIAFTKGFKYVSVLSVGNDELTDLSQYVKDGYIINYPQFIGRNSSDQIVSYTLDSIINNS